ncbi:hypothetical protein HYX05_04595 [Candidatus Woesearchaeota archaeon]|nr:hypothetical protein [Candidatus Woesearchaeota archaeon]
MIAKTLSEIVKHPLVSRALHRREPIEDIIEEAVLRWNLHMRELHQKRNPAPTYIESPDGIRTYQGTDYDLLSLMGLLGARHAVINLPVYEGMREHSLQSNQRVIANENRHGQVLRLVSHLESHSFSILVRDFMVKETGKDGRERVGAPRSFAVVDDSGQLYHGFSALEWDESQDEARFIQEKKLEAFRGNIKFRYAVTPSLAMAFYGQRYLVPAIIEARRIDEVRHYKEVEQWLRDKGVRLPPPPDDEKVVYVKEGQKESLKVENLEAKVAAPENLFTGTYPVYGIKPFSKGEKPKLKRYTSMPTTREGRQEVLRYCLWHIKKLTYKYGPMIRVPTRVVELAFFLYGFKSPDRENGTELKPGWKVPEWERDHKEKPRSRIKWNKMDLGNVQLLYRIRESTVYRRAQTIPVYLNNGS